MLKKGSGVRLVAAGICAALMVGPLAGCQPQTGGTSGGSSSDELLEFEFYRNYSWDVGRYEFDETNDISKWVIDNKKVKVNFSWPGGSAEDKFTLMVASDTLPEVVMIPRDSTWLNLISKDGKSDKILALDEFYEKYEGYRTNVSQEVVDFTRVNGKIYGILNWPKMGDGWMGYGTGLIINRDIYEELGSPDISTLDGLYQYLKQVKEADPTVVPLQPGSGEVTFGLIWCSFGEGRIPEDITVIFEKENIDTSNMTSEMILTCLSAFAQAESESISSNVTKGIRMRYNQGKFSFRYKNSLGYRKGPDGRPEIIPEQADAILMMARDFLDGSSLEAIKEKLESQGVLTATGGKNWSKESIKRILQNERYMGDTLLQKTYTTDFLEGKVKKNQGEVTQYYIHGSHPAIIPREMFFRIQEEFARRNSKKAANAKKSKTNRGRFTSKYALSERLVCGECGSYYRRVTWNIHGRKEIVWRCINRLEFGPKACGKSPSLIEESLHHAILEAIRSLVDGHQEEMAASLRETLVDCLAEQMDSESPQTLQGRIEELEQEFDRLLPMAAEENEVIDRKLKWINDELLQLKQKKKRAEHSAKQMEAREAKAKEVMAMVSAEDLDLTEYSDTLVYRIVERVTVLSKEEIRIRFIGGLEISQPLI